MLEQAVINYEYTYCVICGSSQSVKEARGQDYVYNCCKDYFDIVRCLECGHLYLNPRPSPICAEVIYPKNYATIIRRYSKAKFIIPHIKSWIILNRLKLVKQIFKKGAHILDVGCGDGQLLIDLRKHYPDLLLTGLDLNFGKESLELLIKNNINIIRGRLEDIELPRNYFDLIVMNQLIEHLWDPQRGLQKAFSALRVNGLLSIETVNTEGYDRKFFKTKFWGGYYMPRHLNLFNHRSLRFFLEKLGFKFEAHYNLLAPIIWIFSVNAWLKAHLKYSRWIANFFSDTNPLALFLFSMVDAVGILFGRTTSNQKIVVSKPSIVTIAEDLKY